MAKLKSKVGRFLRNRARKIEKQNRGWRGIVFNRGFVVVVILFGMWLYEEPWAAIWIGSAIIGGIVVAVLIRANHAD